MTMIRQQSLQILTDICVVMQFIESEKESDYYSQSQTQMNELQYLINICFDIQVGTQTLSIQSETIGHLSHL